MSTDGYTICLRQSLSVNDINGAPKSGVLKNGLITLWKIIPSEARNSQ